MREICIETKTSDNHKRKNLSIVETINQEGVLATAEKKYSYYVSEKEPFVSQAEVQNWMDTHADGYEKKDKHVSIRKIYNQDTGLTQMVYRVIGSFYVVQNLHLFAVVFMHCIKFDVLPKQDFPNAAA